MSNIKTYGVLFGLLIGIIVAGTIVFSNLFDDSKEISFTDDTPIISSDRLTVHEIIDSSLIFQTAHFETNKKSLVEFYLTPRDHIRVTNNSGAQLLDEVRIELKLEFLELYELVSSPDNVVVIYPTFTSAAYSEPGFYTFFRGQCDESCITDLSFDTPTLGFTSSGMSTQLLHILGYEFLTDVDVDKNPDILKNYDAIILLHNEYVTQKMFDAVTSHPNIVYLFPNALYAEIDVNYDDNTMTLIRGHNYPEFEIKNGFNYEIEQRFHDYEYDTDCIDWEFIEFENGHALNCYPDLMIHTDLDILLKMKEF
mgnify:FL=1